MFSRMLHVPAEATLQHAGRLMRETLQRLLLSSASKWTHGASAAKCANIFHMPIHPRRCLPRPDKHRTGLRSGICLFNHYARAQAPSPKEDEADSGTRFRFAYDARDAGRGPDLRASTTLVPGARSYDMLAPRNLLGGGADSIR